MPSHPLCVPSPVCPPCLPSAAFPLPEKEYNKHLYKIDQTTMHTTSPPSPSFTQTGLKAVRKPLRVEVIAQEPRPSQASQHLRRVAEPIRLKALAIHSAAKDGEVGTTKNTFSVLQEGPVIPNLRRYDWSPNGILSGVVFQWFQRRWFHGTPTCLRQMGVHS